jgi:hypothetical protein
MQNQKLYKTVTLESFAVVCYVPEHRVGGIMRDFLEVGHTGTHPPLTMQPHVTSTACTGLLASIRFKYCFSHSACHNAVAPPVSHGFGSGDHGSQAVLTVHHV